MTKFILFSLIALFFGSSIAYMTTIHTGLIELYWLNWHIKMPVWVGCILILSILTILHILQSCIISALTSFQKISQWQNKLKQKKNNRIYSRALKDLILGKPKLSLNRIQQFSTSFHPLSHYLLIPYLLKLTKETQSKNIFEMKKELIEFLKSNLSSQTYHVLLIHLYAYVQDWESINGLVEQKEISPIKKNNHLNTQLIFNALYHTKIDEAFTLFKNHQSDLTFRQKKEILHFCLNTAMETPFKAHYYHKFLEDLTKLFSKKEAPELLSLFEQIKRYIEQLTTPATEHISD